MRVYRAMFFCLAATILVSAAIVLYMHFTDHGDGYQLVRYEPSVGWTFEKNGKEVTAVCAYNGQRFLQLNPALTLDLRVIEPMPGGNYRMANGACSELLRFIGRKTPLQLQGDKLLWIRGKREMGLVVLQAGNLPEVVQ